MSKPPNYRTIDCCENCNFISWLSRKDAWCIKHEIDLNPVNEISILWVCNDYEDD